MPILMLPSSNLFTNTLLPNGVVLSIPKTSKSFILELYCSPSKFEIFVVIKSFLSYVTPDAGCSKTPFSFFIKYNSSYVSSAFHCVATQIALVWSIVSLFASSISLLSCSSLSISLIFIAWNTKYASVLSKIGTISVNSSFSIGSCIISRERSTLYLYASLNSSLLGGVIAYTSLFEDSIIANINTNTIVDFILFMVSSYL